MLRAEVIFGMLALLGTGVFLWLNAQARATIGGPFRLIDTSGHVVTSEDFRGKYLLIYFGYTQCADVCPTTLGDVASALDALGSTGNKVTPLFITVDPKRDTPDVLRKYLAAISPRLIGLTGPADEVTHVEKEFHIYAKKDANAAHQSEYGIDHGATLYLMGPDGRFVRPISPTTDVRELTMQIAKLVR